MSLYNFISIDLGAIRVSNQQSPFWFLHCNPASLKLYHLPPNPKVKWEIICGQSPPPPLQQRLFRVQLTFAYIVFCAFLPLTMLSKIQKLWSLNPMQRTRTVGQRGKQASTSVCFRPDIIYFSDCGWRWYHSEERYQGECERLLIPPHCYAYSRSCHS